MFIESILLIYFFYIVQNIQTEHLIYVFCDCRLHLREDYYCPSQHLFKIFSFPLFYGAHKEYVPRLHTQTYVSHSHGWCSVKCNIIMSLRGDFFWHSACLPTLSTTFLSLLPLVQQRNIEYRIKGKIQTLTYLPTGVFLPKLRVFFDSFFHLGTVPCRRKVYFQ